MTHSDLGSAFQQLDATLTANQLLWTPQPFIRDDLPWYQSHPQLKDALLALDEDLARDLHDNSQHRIAWFRAMQPTLCDKLYAFEPPPTLAARPVTLGRFDHVGISGRKWQQITAFASALPPGNVPVIDWCAGKGHLSRIVQRGQQQSVHCLEWDAALLSAGSALAEKQQLDIHYHHHDVMQPLPSACADPESLHIGLHACGELHMQLLRHVANSQAHGMALSPCCYHKISAEVYQPLSDLAQQSKLTLNRQALHLAVQDTVTARRGERLLREKERLWRLGFDALQREITGTDQYMNIPSSNSKLLRQDFAHFCQWAANARQLPLPAHIDYEHYLQRGREKHRQVLRLDLLRRVFSRPLELWLVLDRALYLEERGYTVNISRFCDGKVSPRNLLLQAQRG